MEAKIIQNFKGIINGIIIDHQNVYCSTEYIIEQMEDHFDINVDNMDFTELLSETIHTMYSKYENFSFAELESEFTNCIKSSDTIEELQFNYHGDTWKIEALNILIKMMNIAKVIK